MNEMPENHAPIVIVAGMGKKARAIGKENELLWHIPEDLKRFKQLTLGHPVIMGRKTFESIVKILGEPLPKRTNIVITRHTDYEYEGVRVAHSLSEAIKIAQSENPTEIHIGGGEEIYRQILPYVSKLRLTFFFDNKEGDTFFPDFTEDFVVSKEYQISEHKGLKYQWVDFVRKT